MKNHGLLSALIGLQLLAAPAMAGDTLYKALGSGISGPSDRAGLLKETEGLLQAHSYLNADRINYNLKVIQELEKEYDAKWKELRAEEAKSPKDSGAIKQLYADIYALNQQIEVLNYEIAGWVKQEKANAPVAAANKQASDAVGGGKTGIKYEDGAKPGLFERLAGTGGCHKYGCGNYGGYGGGALDGMAMMMGMSALSGVMDKLGEKDGGGGGGSGGGHGGGSPQSSAHIAELERQLAGSNKALAAHMQADLAVEDARIKAAADAKAKEDNLKLAAALAASSQEEPKPPTVVVALIEKKGTDTKIQMASLPGREFGLKPPTTASARGGGVLAVGIEVRITAQEEAFAKQCLAVAPKAPKHPKCPEAVKKYEMAKKAQAKKKITKRPEAPKTTAGTIPPKPVTVGYRDL